MRYPAARLLVLFAAFSDSASASDLGNGIVVSEPKLYDDYALERMLFEAQQSLEAVQLMEATSISSALGATQGIQITQTQLGLSAVQLPSPQVVETQSTTPSTMTTAQPFTPTPPQLSAPPALTPPSAVGLAAIDKLDEFLQLKLRVSNLRLLLRGSLTDQVSLVRDGDGKVEMIPQSRFTFGFPVSLVPRAGRLYRDAVAEVEVRLMINGACAPPGSRPGLKMVLPQEKTYNVAQLRSSSTSIGTGAVSGAFSIGGNWLRGQSKLFLVQDQDTLAFEGESQRDGEIVFGWRFKPVLGQRKVQPSLQQLFAQITFPIPPGAAMLGEATVTTRWRLYERKTGALGIEIPGTDHTQSFPLRRIDLAPGPVGMEFIDLGSGKVRVNLKPEVTFFEGTTLRLGGGSPVEVARQSDHVLLDLTPLEAVRQGVLVGVRGEKERPLVNACNDLGEVDALRPCCEPLPSVAQAQRIAAGIDRQREADSQLTNAAIICKDPFSGFKITDVDIEPIGHAASRVKITLDKLKPLPRQGEMDLPFLTLVGDKAFGLRDAPYETYTPCCPPVKNPKEDKRYEGCPVFPCTGVIELIADNTTLEKAGSVEVVRLLWGPEYHAWRKLDHQKKLTIAKHTILSENNGLRLLVEGQGLDRAVVLFPQGIEAESCAPGHVILHIPKTATTALKHLVLQSKSGGAPVLIDVSKSTPPPPTPVLNPLDPVKIGTSVKISISWKNDAVIEAVTHEEAPQSFTPSSKTGATIQLADALTVRPGKLTLKVKFKDVPTALPLTVQLVDQQVAVVPQ